MSTAALGLDRRIHLDWLTALRFFAALAVLICHLAIPLGLRGRAYEGLAFGQFGVDFFFVLSGFVLAWSWKPSRSALRFYWLRFARIWPLHLAVLLAVFVLGVRAPLRDVLLQVFLVQQWDPTAVYVEGLNGVSWTLAVEVFFYALFPLLVTQLARKGPLQLGLFAITAWCTVLGLLIVAHGWPQPLKDWTTFSNPAVRLPQFVAGMAVAFCLQRPEMRRVSSTAIRAAQAAALFAIVVAWAGYTATAGGHLPYWSWLLTPVMVLLVGSFALGGIVLAHRPPRLLIVLGEWSFALYLVHRGLVYNLLFPRTQDWSHWISIPLALVLSVALAGLAHELLEKPLERWLRGHGPREVHGHPIPTALKR